MNTRRLASFALIAVYVGTAVAQARNPPSRKCCDPTPAWALGVESGAIWAKTEEIVEARSEYAADYLSYLTWETLTGVAGIHLRYRTRGILRINGRFWYLANARDGTLVNLDYLDSTSDVVTHRSVSTSELIGVGWELSTDLMLVEETRGGVYMRSFARLAYRGNYHSWKARGGEYEYLGRQGRFDVDEELIRYLVLHQVVGLGVFVELGQVADGLYGRLGGTVSPLPLVDDRDTHALSDTEYYNTYRRGWYVQPEIAVGIGLGGRLAVEAFYEPALQFEFEETSTQIKRPHGVYVPEEKPNYKMTLHRVGIRLLWSVLSK